MHKEQLMWLFIFATPNKIKRPSPLLKLKQQQQQNKRSYIFKSNPQML